MRKLTALALAVTAALSGCAIVVVPDTGDVSMHTAWSDSGVKGDGQTTAEKRQVGSATALDISGPLTVDVRVGQAPSLEVEGDGNLLPMLRTEVNGDTLRVWVEGNVRPTNGLRVRYTTTQLQRVDSSGSGRLVIQGLNGAPLWLKASGSRHTILSGRVASLDAQLTGSGGVEAGGLTTGDVSVELTGSGRMLLGQVNGGAVRVKTHGSGSVQASGTARRLDVKVHGSGGANFSGLSADAADLYSYGSGDITARVNNAVLADANGSGHITVYGNPAQRSLSGRHVTVVN